MPPALQLALLIAILLPAGKIVAAIFTRYGIPAILGELMVGVVAGPGCIDMLHMHLFSGTPAADSLSTSRANRRLRPHVHRGT